MTSFSKKISDSIEESIAEKLALEPLDERAEVSRALEETINGVWDGNHIDEIHLSDEEHDEDGIFIFPFEAYGVVEYRPYKEDKFVHDIRIKITITGSARATFGINHHYDEKTGKEIDYDVLGGVEIDDNYEVEVETEHPEDDKELIKLGHNNPPVEEAIQAVGEAIPEIEAYRPNEEEQISEKNAILHSVQSGYQALKNRLISKYQLMGIWGALIKAEEWIVRSGKIAAALSAIILLIKFLGLF